MCEKIPLTKFVNFDSKFLGEAITSDALIADVNCLAYGMFVGIDCEKMKGPGEKLNEFLEQISRGLVLKT